MELRKNGEKRAEESAFDKVRPSASTGARSASPPAAQEVGCALHRASAGGDRHRAGKRRDEETAIAALLHDAVEDQGGQPTLDRIRREFGEKVARIVDECSDADGEPKPPWRFRKEQYLAALPHKSAEALLVSFGDKIHNCRSIVSDLRRDGESVWNRFEGRREGTLWYYRELLEKFPREPYASLYDEFAATVRVLNEVAGSH